MNSQDDLCVSDLYHNLDETRMANNITGRRFCSDPPSMANLFTCLRKGTCVSWQPNSPISHPVQGFCVGIIEKHQRKTLVRQTATYHGQTTRINIVASQLKHHESRGPPLSHRLPVNVYAMFTLCCCQTAIDLMKHQKHTELSFSPRTSWINH